MTASSVKTIASLEKALHILEAVNYAPRELSIVDLVDVTGYGRSSVQRLVHTLCAVGVLSRNPGTTTAFSLGASITRYAHTYLATHPLIEVAMPFMVNLNSQIDLGCDLWLVDGDDLVTSIRIPKLNGSEPMTAAGKRLQGLHSAAGMAIYTSLPQERQEQWYATYLQSIEGKKAQRPDTVAALRNGYYFLPGDQSGVSYWSAPIYDYSNDATAAITVSGHIDAEDQAAIAEIGKKLAQCARNISDMRIQSYPDRRLNPTFESRAHEADSDEKEDRLIIKAVENGLQLLDCLKTETPVLTLTDFHRMTGFSIPMIQRITNTLTLAGYLVRNDNQKTFRLTAKTLDFIYGFQSKFQLLKVIWPRLLELRRQLGLRCSFCILEKENIVHLLNIQSASHAEFKAALVGDYLPAASTSGGRILLAQKSDEEVDQLLESVDIEAVTPNTVTDKKAIKEIIQQAREKGFGFTDEQSVPNEVNMAVPIKRKGQDVVGAIVVSAPKLDWDYDRLVAEVVPMMKQVAHQIR